MNIVAALGLALLLALGADGERHGKAGPRKIKTPSTEKTSAEDDAAYEKLVELDDATEKEVEKMVNDAEAFEKAGAGVSKAVLSAKVNARFDVVKKAYEDFLSKHPKYIEARLAFGSFLNDINDEEGAIVQWDKARLQQPDDPAAWNNLGNIYAHHGPIIQAFEYYEKAIQLGPKESVYLQNLAVCVYLFRRDAEQYYKIPEKEVFDKALALYDKALDLDPKNFLLATDTAQSYYGIKPLRTVDALKAWNRALNLASNDLEREGTCLHLARVELNSGMFQEAQTHLDLVKLPDLSELKTLLQKNLDRKKEASLKQPAAQGQGTLLSPSSQIELKQPEKQSLEPQPK